MAMEAKVAASSKKHAGKPLYPHKNRDGFYIASHSRFKADYILVETEEQLEALVSLGYGARMSNPSMKIGASLISSKSIKLTKPISFKSTLASVVKSTDSKSTVKRRLEQSFLRSHLLSANPTGKCVICGNEFPANFLVAAHIKKRAKCTTSEKLDFDNIASLMCKLGCDDLFEKGYIYITSGSVAINTKAKPTPVLEKYLTEIDGNVVPNWLGSKAYYEWHAHEWGCA
ncbi:hypothetical protein [Vibrio sp. MA40-2]|uniref:hypothetical protein n=1 Tax=Vibrio sp. MA40-2 TaxID=3391828 RepID=UPI0039A6C7A5